MMRLALVLATLLAATALVPASSAEGAASAPECGRWAAEAYGLFAHAHESTTTTDALVPQVSLADLVAPAYPDAQAFVAHAKEGPGSVEAFAVHDYVTRDLGFAQGANADSSLVDMSLLSGIITAKTVHAYAMADDFQVMKSGGWSYVEDLRIYNNLIPIGAGQNTVIPLGALGTVTINEIERAFTPEGSFTLVHALHVRLSANAATLVGGSDIVVGSAYAAVGATCAAPPPPPEHCVEPTDCPVQPICVFPAALPCIDCPDPTTCIRPICQGPACVDPGCINSTIVQICDGLPDCNPTEVQCIRLPRLPQVPCATTPIGRVCVADVVAP